MRFDITDLAHGLVKVLRNGSDRTKADRLAWSALILLPVLAGGVMLVFCTPLRAPGSVLTGVAILAGGFLTSFTHLSTLRAKLTDRADVYSEAEEPERDLLDEVATLLLVATLSAVLTAVVLVASMNLSSTPELSGWAGAVPTAAAVWTLTLFVLTIPRLYNAYLQLNKVRPALSGANRR